MYLLKSILIIIGTISLSLGIIGIVVPGLPTTPFLLLTAGLYLRSSNKLYNKVISNKWIGPYIVRYNENKGMSAGLKLYAVSLMSLMITISCMLFINSTSIRLIIIGLGIIGAIVMIFIVPTVNSKTNK